MCKLSDEIKGTSIIKSASIPPRCDCHTLAASNWRGEIAEAPRPGRRHRAGARRWASPARSAPPASWAASSASSRRRRRRRTAASSKRTGSRASLRSGSTPGLKDPVADRSNHSDLCSSESRYNSVRIQDFFSQ